MYRRIGGHYNASAECWEGGDDGGREGCRSAGALCNCLVIGTSRVEVCMGMGIPIPMGFPWEWE